MKHNIHPIPKLPVIGRNDDTEGLYALEHQRNEILRSNAKELAKILGHTEAEYRDKTIPELLASTLDSYEPPAGIAAAIGYLKTKGEVTFTATEIPNTKPEPVKDNRLTRIVSSKSSCGTCGENLTLISSEGGPLLFICWKCRRTSEVGHAAITEEPTNE